MRKLLTAAVITAAAACPLVACSSSGSSSPEAPPAPPNVSKDWMEVFPGDSRYHKRCDGTTLVYLSHVNYGESIAVIPNSPECAPAH